MSIGLVTFGPEVTAAVEVASGDRFEGATRVHLRPGESFAVEVPTDLTGAVRVCEARMPEILSRVETNP